MNWLSGKKLLITGACSFVGRHLVHYLLSQENADTFSLILCCKDRQKAKRYFDEKKVLLVQADLREPESYSTIFKHHPDIVIHLAAIARFKDGEKDPEAAVRVNFIGSVKLMEMAEKFGVTKFLFVSSNLARHPEGVTGFTKYLTEVYIQRRVGKMEVVSIRLPNVMDSPGAVTLIFKRQIEKDEPITITDKRMSRKFITPEMAAEQLLFALEHGKNKDVIINNRPSTPIVELAKQMMKNLGKRVPVVFIGARPGEKLSEEDYPLDSIKPVGHQELFVLKENQYGQEQVNTILNKLSPRISKKVMREIELVLTNINEVS